MEQKPIDLNVDDFETLLLSAVRGELIEKTAITPFVQDMVEKNIRVMSLGTMTIMMTAIRNYCSVDDNACELIGRWLHLHDELEAEAAFRGSPVHEDNLP